MAGLCAGNAGGARRSWRAASSAAMAGGMPMAESELRDRELWARSNRRWTIAALILAGLIVGAAAANIAAVAMFAGS